MMNCCHGGCDNCAYSHIFDNLSSGRPKWIPLYSYRKLIDGRSHLAPWASIFHLTEDCFTSTDTTSTDTLRIGVEVNKEEFAQRLQALPSRMVMGPSISVPTDEGLSDEAVEALWSMLCSHDSHTLTHTQVNRTSLHSTYFTSL